MQSPILLLLGSVFACSNALMFHSEAVTKEWDTWVFVENSTYYAYYLVTEVSTVYICIPVALSLPSRISSSSSTPNLAIVGAFLLFWQVSFGEGFGLATSPDGQHWDDQGYVWHG